MNEFNERILELIEREVIEEVPSKGATAFRLTIHATKLLKGRKQKSVDGISLPPVGSHANEEVTDTSVEHVPSAAVNDHEDVDQELESYQKESGFLESPLVEPASGSAQEAPTDAASGSDRFEKTLRECFHRAVIGSAATLPDLLRETRASGISDEDLKEYLADVQANSVCERLGDLATTTIRSGELQAE